MPDHANKLGELARMMKFEAAALDDKFGHEVMASLRYKQAAAILDALGPVVEAIESGGEMKTTPEGWTFGMKLKYADAKSLYAAVENLR